MRLKIRLFLAAALTSILLVGCARQAYLNPVQFNETVKQAVSIAPFIKKAQMSHATPTEIYIDLTLSENKSNEEELLQARDIYMQYVESDNFISFVKHEPGLYADDGLCAIIAFNNPDTSSFWYTSLLGTGFTDWERHERFNDGTVADVIKVEK